MSEVDITGQGGNLAAKAPESARKARDDAAEAARALADNAAAAGRRTAAAAEDVARTASSTATESLRSGAEAASQILQRTTDQYMSIFGLSGDLRRTEEAARESSGNIKAIADCNSMIAHAAQDISREWMALAQTTAQKNIEGLNELVGCRSLPDLFSVQSRIMRENMESMFAAGQKIARVSLQVTQEATARIGTRGGQNTTSPAPVH